MNDAVLIYDGPDGNNFITDYCGKSGWDDVPSTAEELTVVFKSNENVITRSGFTVTFKAELLPPAQFAENTIKKAFTEIQSLVHIGHDHKREHLQNKKARIYFPTVAKAPKSQEDRTSLLAKLKFERSFASLSFDQIKLERSFASLFFLCSI